MDVKMNFDDQAARAMLENVIRGMSDFTPAIRDSERELKGETDEAFNVAGKNINGEPWQKLSPNYLKQKIRSGFLTQILVRTGKMRASFLTLERTKESLKIGNSAEYFPTHQIGSGAVPQRQVLGFPDRMKEKLVDIFQKYLLSLL